MLGLESTVTLGIQPSAANPAMQNRTSLNIYKITGGGSQTQPDDPILGGGLNNGSDGTEPGPGLKDHKLMIGLPVCEAQFPLWLRGFFGEAVQTDNDPHFEYAYSSGAAVLPYCYIEHQLRANDYRRHFGCVGETLDIDWSSDAEGFAQASMGFIGLEEAPPAVAALGGVITPAPALVRAPQSEVNITYNGVATVIGGKLSFKRTLKRHRNADGSGKPYAIEYNGKSSLSGSFNVRYTGTTMNADAAAMIAREAVLELLSSPTRGLRFALPTMRLAVTPVPVEGPDGIEFEFPWTAWQTAANPALIVTALTGLTEAPAP